MYSLRRVIALPRGSSAGSRSSNVTVGGGSVLAASQTCRRHSALAVWAQGRDIQDSVIINNSSHH